MSNYWLDLMESGWKNWKIGDRVVVSNPTPKDEKHPHSRSPQWKGKTGTIIGFQGQKDADEIGVIVSLDEITSSRLCFISYELSLEKKPWCWTNNNRFLQEAIELDKVWREKGLDWATGQGYSRAVTAVMLEGERLMNERCDDPNDVTTFKRIVIPKEKDV